MTTKGLQIRSVFVDRPFSSENTSRPWTKTRAVRQQYTQRRNICLSTIAFYVGDMLQKKAGVAANDSEAPPEGACVDCIGEVNGGLNACTLASPSCVSTQNDDEAHFVPPWQYNGNKDAAVQRLIETATGQSSSPPTAQSRSNISLHDAADYSFEELRAAIQGGRPPAKPKGKLKVAERNCFHGLVQSRHRTADGSEYLHLTFGEIESDNQSCRANGVLDAEFIFLSGDNVVDIRTASRLDPGVRGGNLSLSLSYGVQYDNNVAKREMEKLRKALDWEQVPVITDFDPRFNQRRPLFFERLYQPFLREKQDFDDIVDK